MKQAQNNPSPNTDLLYEFCWTNNKLTEDNVDMLLVLAAINNDEITAVALRGYLPISWAACTRIAQAMEEGGLAKYVDQFSKPMVHLPEEVRRGVWNV
jgi:hypothetical protein